MADVNIDTLTIKINSDAGNAVKGVDKLVKSLEKLQSVLAKKFDTKQITELGSALAKFKGGSGVDSIAKLSRTLNALERVTQTYAVAALARQVNELSQALDNMSDKAAKRIHDIALAFGMMAQSAQESAEDSSTATDTVKSLGASWQKVGLAASKVFNIFKLGAKGVATSLKYIAGGPFILLGKGLSNLIAKARNFFAMFKKRLMYRVINAIISAVSNAVKEGTSNLYQYSKALGGTFAKSMDRASTSLLYFKNSIGAMIAPLVNMLVPALEYVIGKVVDFVNILNQLFARLSGASTWTQALMYPIEYADAANDATAAAKKWKATILGIDELNLMQDNSSNGSGGGASGIDYSQMFQEVELAGESIFGEFFKPFQEAWANEGMNTINAIRGAFESLKELFRVVGQSFNEVWQNGTGQETVEHILRIVQDIAYVVGGLADSFAEAWAANDTGTRIVQAIWDIFNSILGTIERIIGATAEWAASLDFGPVLGAFATLFESIKPIVDEIGNLLSWIWEELILPIAGWLTEEVSPVAIESIAHAFDILKGVIDLVKPTLNWLWNKVLKPMGKWTADALTTALQTISNLLGAISEVLQGENLQDVLDKLSPFETVLLGIATGIGAVVAAVTLYNVAMSIYSAITGVCTAATGLFAGALAFLTSPIGLIIVALAALAAGALLVVKYWDEISAWIVQAWNDIVSFLAGIWEAVSGFFISIWEAVSGFFVKIWTAISDFFTSLWESVSGFFVGLWESIVEVFSPAIEWFSELFGSIWQTISDIFYNIGVIAKGCWEIIKAVWGLVSEWFDSHVIQPVANFFTGLWNGVKNIAISAWNGIKAFFTPIVTWFQISIIQPLSHFFTNLWSGFKTGAKKAWEGVKSVFSKVAEFFKKIFTDAWQGIVKVFSIAGEIFVDIKDGVVSAFKWVVNGLINGINKVVSVPFNAINDVLRWLRDITIVGIQPFSGIREINVPQIPTLAQGGVVDSGTMFVAGEAGPEVVGQFGGRTGVMNTDQMRDSVAEGVAEANREQNALLREEISLLRMILDKDTDVRISTANIIDSLSRKNRRDGRTIVPVGT